MKILVTYSSLTGNTKKLAEGIYEELLGEKEIMPIGEVKDLSQYDVVLVGYWVDKGGPNEEAKKFLEAIEEKKVGIFATLAYWPDTDHGWKSLINGEKLVKDKNQVIGKYICQGKLSDSIIERFKSLPEGNPHAITPEKLKRYEISSKHPSEIDIAAGAQLFRERLY